MTVFFSLDTQYENLGDEAINVLLLNEIAKRQELEVFSGGAPGWYRENIRAGLSSMVAGVRFVDNRKAFLSRFILHVLLKRGTTLLLSCGDVTSTCSNRKRARMMGMIGRLPFASIAQVGASRLALPESDYGWLACAAAKQHAITVRDRYSVTALAEVGIKVPLLPDLAFLSDFQPACAPETALFMLRDSKSDLAARVVRMSALIEAAREAGLTPAFGWQVSRDEILNRNLAKQTGADVFVLPTAGQDRMAPTLAAYENVAVIVSNRLHGLLLAAARGAVPIALLHDSERKVRGVFEQAGLGALIIPEKGEADSTTSAFLSILADAPKHRAAVARAFTENTAALHKGFNTIFGPVRQS